MSVATGSVAVLTTATPLLGFPNVSSPGSLVLINSGANAVTIGPSTVTAGEAGTGLITIPPNSVVPVAKLGAWGATSGALYAIAAATGSILSWIYGTEIST